MIKNDNITSLISIKKENLGNAPIVFLKSGSPALTVRVISKGQGNVNTVMVDWFVEGDHCTATFLESQLTFERDEK